MVRAVAAMPDGKRILKARTAAPSRCRSSTAPTRHLRGLHAQTVLAVALPDNRHALSGRNDIKLFNVNDGGVLRTFKHHTNTVSSLALMPDGLRFVSASYDRTARIVEHGLAPQ